MCEFCFFERGRMFNVIYLGAVSSFDKLDISMGKPYLTKYRNGREVSRKVVKECPQCGRKLEVE